MEQQPDHNEENPVVKIIDNATFNRTSLLGDMADQAYKLDQPGEDYPTAARLAWNAMRREATRKEPVAMTGDNGRDGYIVVGMGPSQALQLMWPAMEKNQLLNAINAVRHHLKDSDNAVCIRQGRKATLPEWWVSDEWQEIKVRHPRNARANSLKRKKKAKQVPTSALVEPVATPAAPVPEPVVTPAGAVREWNDASPDHNNDDVESREWETRLPPLPVDELEQAFDTIRRIVANAAAAANAENKLLRERLDRITDVLKGD